MDSTQLTNRVNAQPNPAEAELALWLQTRYLVAQTPAEDSDYTGDGWYKGRIVVPAPKAAVGSRMANYDLELVKNTHYIRMIDSRTTQGADASVGRALYVPMTNAEADEYEAQLRIILGIKVK